MKFRFKVLAAVMAASQLGACANLVGPVRDNGKIAAREARLATEQAQARDEAPQGFKEFANSPFVDFDVKPSHPFAGDVSLQVTDAPVGPVLVELARRSGYEIAFADGVDMRKPVTVGVTDVTGRFALRQVAGAAGYAAVIDEAQKTVTVAEQATYVFKLPIQLLNSAGGNFSVGGNPMAGGGSGAGGDSASGISASFNIKGEVKGATAKGFLEQVKSVAGGQAVVTLNEEAGMLTVRGAAQSLNRVSRFVTNQVREASTQVWVETTVVEVTLANDFAVGVDWGRIFNAGNGLTATLKGAASVGGSNAPLSVAYTTANSRTVVDALMKHANVKIISNPTVMMTNHVPSSIFQGRSEPYLPAVTTTTTGTSGTTSTSAKAEFATSGLMLSAVADVLDDKRVQMTLMPVLTRVEGFEDLPAGEQTLRVPIQSSNSTTMRVTAETGRTLIIGGIRTQSGNTTQDLGFAGSSGQATELVILVRARVMPVEATDPIVTELL